VFLKSGRDQFTLSPCAGTSLAMVGAIGELENGYINSRGSHI